MVQTRIRSFGVFGNKSNFGAAGLTFIKHNNGIAVKRDCSGRGSIAVLENLRGSKREISRKRHFKETISDVRGDPSMIWPICIKESELSSSKVM